MGSRPFPSAGAPPSVPYASGTLLALVLPGLPGLPGGVACAESRVDLDEPLPPGEADLAAGLAASRGREFVTGRVLARRALGMLGAPQPSMARTATGGPVWPSGYVGSITHCTGYRAAAAAGTHTVSALGIDAEPAGPLPAEVRDLVLTGAERERGAAAPHPFHDRIVFSAKESAYKCVADAAGRWLEYPDVDVTPRADGTLSLVIAGLGVVTGKWAVADGFVLTACWARAPQDGAGAGGRRA